MIPRALRTRTWEWASVLFLLALYYVLATSAAKQKGPAFDEPGHLVSGWNIWSQHDFRLDPGNGDFPKRWAAIPLLFSPPVSDWKTDPMWRAGLQHPLGFHFLFGSGNDPGSLLAQGRGMIALLGVLLGLLIYFSARQIFGVGGGLIALALFTFSPAMLANGALVTADLPIALALFAATWFAWRLLQRLTPLRIVLSLAATSLLIPTKLSGLAIVPIGLILIAVRQRRTPRVPWRVLIALGAAHAACAWAAIWASYDFRYLARRDPADTTVSIGVSSPPGKLAAPSAVFRLCARFHLLPEGFLAGTENLAGGTQTRLAFKNGDWRVGGWHSFFSYTLWVKTPTALWILIALGAGVWAARRGAQSTEPFSVYELSPHLVLLTCYGAIIVVQNLNIGHRHALPLYPPLFVLAGSASLAWSIKSQWPRWGAILLLGWLVWDSWAIRPDYGAYFTELSGGAATGYRHLVDSSLDWGMDLPGLKRWLDVHNPEDREPVYLAYFGTGSPDYYGIRSQRLPGFVDWRRPGYFPLGPGIYAISATLLESDVPPTFGPWNPTYEQLYQRAAHDAEEWAQGQSDPKLKAQLLRRQPEAAWTAHLVDLDHLRFGRLCAWLRQRRPPDAMVGYSILIWRLSSEDLQAALTAPPTPA